MKIKYGKATKRYFLCIKEWSRKNKFKKELHTLKASDCDFWFYKESGVWGMYGDNVRHYWFCIPFIAGFRYSKSW